MSDEASAGKIYLAVTRFDGRNASGARIQEHTLLSIWKKFVLVPRGNGSATSTRRPVHSVTPPVAMSAMVATPIKSTVNQPKTFAVVPLT